MENDQRKETTTRVERTSGKTNRGQSNEEKANRLRKDREHRQQKRQNGTREEREIRLAKRRDAYKKSQRKIEVKKTV